MTTAVSGPTRPVEQLPEPARFWIGYAPRNWRSAGGLWTDLANARIAGFHGTRGASMPELEAFELDDLFYLPPVVPELAEERDRLAVRLTESGTPVLMQLAPGETTAAADFGSGILSEAPTRPAPPKGRATPPDPPRGGRSTCLVVYDLLTVLLDGDIDHLSELPRGSTAVWPLIGGLTDRPDMWDEGCMLLKIAGVKCVQAIVVELNPSMRRKLAEGRGDDVFDALFHGDPPSEQLFATYGERYGLEPFMPRPRTGVSPRQVRNRRIAADLALAGEIWLRLGKSVGIGQALFRAARGAEKTHHDLAALVKEENLTVMNWLDAHSIAVIEEIVRTGRSTLLHELTEEYLGRRGRIPEPEMPSPR